MRKHLYFRLFLFPLPLLILLLCFVLCAVNDLSAAVQLENDKLNEVEMRMRADCGVFGSDMRAQP